MRRVLLALVVAGAVAIPSSVGAKLSGAGAIDEVAHDEFSRFLDDFSFPAPVPSTPVDEVHTVDPIEGETFPPENAPFPNARPEEWGFVRIEGDPGVLGPLFGTGPTTFTTPGWRDAQETLDALFLAFVHTEGTIDSGVFPGFNFNFDVDPDVFGAKLDNSSTPGDCAIDGFLDPEQPSVSTSVVSPGSTEFTQTDAPLFLRTFADGAIFAFPPAHPCAGATGIAPATYVLAGSQLVEHELVGPNGPFLPMTASTIEIVTDRSALGDGEGGVDGGAGTATVSADEKDDDGINPLLILGGALAAGGLTYGGVRLVQGRRGTNEWIHQDRYGLGTDAFGDPDRDPADGGEQVPTARDPWAILQATPGHVGPPAAGVDAGPGPTRAPTPTPATTTPAAAPAPAPPAETPPPPTPGSDEADLLLMLERHRRAHRERTGEELSPEAESAYLGHLLDDQDHRDMSERMIEALDTPTSGEAPKPSGATPGDPKPEPGQEGDPKPDSGKGSVLDDIDESGPPPGLV